MLTFVSVVGNSRTSFNFILAIHTDPAVKTDRHIRQHIILIAVQLDEAERASPEVL